MKRVCEGEARGLIICSYFQSGKYQLRSLASGVGIHEDLGDSAGSVRRG